MMPLGEHTGGQSTKSWRINVCDPRGGRGTDYRVDDPDVDSHGGLLLIPAVIPSSQRDWVQFLGRTARQDRRGQFCPIICSADYSELSAKYGGSLVSGSLDSITAILTWGDKEAARRIQSSAALYNT